MNQDLIQIKSKLLSPNLSGTIERDRYHPLFKEIKKNRIITVSAGAGYGKTTFIAQACRYLNIATVWYRLDSFDSDFSTFINYLIEGIKQHFKQFGRITTNLIKTKGALKKEQRSILMSFLSEIEETVKDDLIIVLDDYHLIQKSQDISNIITLLSEYMADKVHLVIITRTKPILNLSRFIARRESFNIGEEELTFDIHEIDRLFREIFHHELNRQSLENLFAQTEGWASGLILFNYSIQNKTKGEIEKQLSEVHYNRNVFFDYLEENIYSSLDGDIIDFLLKTSVLSQLDVRFCDQLLGINNSRDILSYLEKNHLFTFPYDEDKKSYYYHHLFQEFLKQKLDYTLQNDARTHFFNHAAELCIAFGKTEEAVGHYISAGFFDKACGLLNSVGRQLIRDAKFTMFSSFYRRIPDEFIEKNPWIQYSHARSLELSGRIYRALDAFQKAQWMFQECGIIKGVGLSLNRLSSNYYTIGDFQKAEEKLKELLHGVKGTPRLYVDVLGHLIFISSHLGNIAEADNYYRKAREALSRLNDDDLQAWIFINYGFRFFASGDLHESRRFGEKSNRISRRIKSNQLLIYSYHLLSISCYYLGEFEKGFENAVKGLKVAEEAGLKEASHAWLFIDACFCKAAMEDTPSAIQYGLEGLQISREIESCWSEAWACHALQEAYTKAKEVLQAEKYAQLAINAIQHLTLPLDESQFKGILASVLIEKGNLDNVEMLLNEAEKNFANSKLNLCRIYLWYARYFYVKNRLSQCIQKLRSALILSEKNQYDSWIIYEKHWIIPLLVEIYHEEKLQAYINKIFLKLGPNYSKDLKDIVRDKGKKPQKAVKSILYEINQNMPSHLKIYCFGKFCIYRGNKEISVETWTSEKSKILFKYLIYNYSRGYISKDRLLEMLWPGEDPGKTNNRFHVALTALRKILEPELTRGVASSFLMRDGESYRIEKGIEGYLDLEEFDNALMFAKRAKDKSVEYEYYFKAESLYRGDLFEEDDYVEWCIEARDFYKEKYLKVLDKIISYYEEKEENLQCIEYLEKYLREDKYSEHIYRILMNKYNAIGNEAMVIKVYERCKMNIKTGLDSPLSNETITLYKKLRHK